MLNEPKKIVFAQGMRRSGTSIIFDLMLESKAFECFYEPLAKAASSLGGGSGVHSEIDLFANVRAARMDFVNANPMLLMRCPTFLTHNFLNYGAPRLPELEFEPDLPNYTKDYIDFLTRRAPRTFLKFTRVHSKVHCLAEIAPDAKFIHIVRDPRHVTASYLFGKNGKNKDRFPDPDVFFERMSGMSAWSSRPFSDFLISMDQKLASSEVEDFLRILLIWKYNFEVTHLLGRDSFGNNYMILQHEELLKSPVETVKKLFDFMEEYPEQRVIDFATQNVRRPSAPYEVHDPRWLSAYDRLGLRKAIELAGYEYP